MFTEINAIFVDTECKWSQRSLISFLTLKSRKLYSDITELSPDTHHASSSLLFSTIVVKVGLGLDFDMITKLWLTSNFITICKIKVLSWHKLLASVSVVYACLYSWVFNCILISPTSIYQLHTLRDHSSFRFHSSYIIKQLHLNKLE